MRDFKFWCVIVLALLLQGCSSMNATEDFQDSSRAIKNLVSSHAPNKDYSVEKMTKKYQDEGLVYEENIATYYFLSGDYERSSEIFKSVLSQYMKIELRRVEEDASDITSYIASGDITRTYFGSFYERIYAHYYQAMNYMMVSDIDKAMVELRAANEIQDYANSRYYNNQLEIDNKDDGKFYLGLDKRFRLGHLNDTKLNAGWRYYPNSYSNFNNASMHYFSGHIRELTGDNNGAYIDYKKAHTIESKNKYFLQDLYRLARQYDSTYASRLLAENPALANVPQANQYRRDLATVLVVYESSFNVSRIDNLDDVRGTTRGVVQKSYPVLYDAYPTAEGSKAPYYTSAYRGSSGASLNIGAQRFNAELGTNLAHMEAFKLQSELPGILTRQGIKTAVVAGAAIGAAAASGDDNAAVVATQLFILFDIINQSFFNYADIRSWNTLPRYSFAIKANSPSAIKDLEITNNLNQKVKLEGIDVQPGEISIIYVRDLSERGNPYHITKVLYKGKKR